MRTKASGQKPVSYLYGAPKHYPTDTAIGLGVGAISGIMVPEFHRWWAKRHRTKAIVTPLYGGGAVGGSFTLHF